MRSAGKGTKVPAAAFCCVEPTSVTAGGQGSALPLKRLRLWAHLTPLKKVERPEKPFFVCRPCENRVRNLKGKLVRTVKMQAHASVTLRLDVTTVHPPCKPPCSQND